MLMLSLGSSDIVSFPTTTHNASCSMRKTLSQWLSLTLYNRKTHMEVCASPGICVSYFGIGPPWANPNHLPTQSLSALSCTHVQLCGFGSPGYVCTLQLWSSILRKQDVLWQSGKATVRQGNHSFSSGWMPLHFRLNQARTHLRDCIDLT